VLATATRRRRSFGKIRKLPSKRFQASYVGPDGRRHTAPSTFDTWGDADTWLASAQTDISRDEWHRPTPTHRVDTFAAYSAAWLNTRQLTPRTRAEYRKILDGHLLPVFGGQYLDDITPVMVRDWHANLATGPTRRAHAYALLRAILNTAVADDAIASNPCRVRGAGQAKRASRTRVPTDAELAVIVDAMPDQYRAAVLLATWCALRFGEIAELRRTDMHLDADPPVVHVHRAVTHVNGADIVGAPKSQAGVREVTVPPHIVPALREHLTRHTQPGQAGLLFPATTGGHMRSNSQLHKAFHDARAAARRPDVRFHDLRHAGLTKAAQAGATPAELMQRAGHSTPNMALRYQHATSDRAAHIAVELSRQATSNVVPLQRRTQRKGHSA
jgi:integrase